MHESLIPILLTSLKEGVSITALCIISFYTPRYIAYLGKNISLQRKSKYDGWLLSDAPFIEKRSVSELQEQVDFRSIKELMPYLEKLENYTSVFNMKNVYRNLATLKIKRSIFLPLIGATGFYDTEKNTIRFLTSSAIGHEFLHLTSSYYDEKTKTEYMGFSQTVKSKSIGNGLNEGYTELLASRIYNKDGKVEAYKKLVELASLFEYFFDDPKDMEKYYFNHDLPGFIAHMEQFAPRRDIIEILIMMDNLEYKSSLPFAEAPSLNEFKIKMKLYDMLKNHCQDPYKLNAFKKQLESSSFLMRMAMKSQKFSLQRDNPYTDKKDNPKTR